MSGFRVFPGSSATDLLNFGPELDRIDQNVATLLANQNKFYATIEAQFSTISQSLSQQISTINATIAQMAVLLEAALVAFHSTGTLANQQLEISLLDQILQDVSSLKAQSIGLDPSLTATAHQPEPSHRGP